ncbi:MAG: TRAP transporter small permease subunit, partial [Alphaproteobacteria bacterium]|nr:TRAP transporter small permease subunit [Alphaproteobacteria bacterium]
AGVRRVIGMVNALLIVGFGILAAWHGWGLIGLNAQLASPALEISLGWLYGSAVIGGALIAVFGVRELLARQRGEAA